MEINKLSEADCVELLSRSSLGRLGCSLDGQPYVVPISFGYEAGYIYSLSTFGQKIEWMRANPKVCLEVEDVASHSQWTTVVAMGDYQELIEPQFSVELERARKLLRQHHDWWQVPLAERQLGSGDNLISPLFFRIHINSISGLRSCR